MACKPPSGHLVQPSLETQVALHETIVKVLRLAFVEIPHVLTETLIGFTPLT